MHKTFAPWLRLIKPFAILFLAIQLLTRIGLLIYSGAAADAGVVQFIGMFAWGLVFDLQVLGLFLFPIVVIHMFASPLAWDGRGLRLTRMVFFAVYTYVWLFTSVSEYFFWDEFTTRFNFIAVDYLVYTTEVIGNIQESYPLYPILSALGVATALLVYGFRRQLRLDGVMPLKRRHALALLAVPVVMLFVINNGQVNLSPDQKIQELAMNGTYNLFSAYRNNELSYKKFYTTLDEKTVASRVRAMLAEDYDTFVNNDPDDITRLIKHDGPELHKNVVFVVMESMSGEFMGVFGNANHLTPSMDALSKDSLFFTDLYATGTRTVRGLEAVTLSAPPTPGQSILRRPDNGGLYSLGYVFQDRGYDTAFIYGGHGYFDNMNAFFSANGFRIVDRTDFADSDVTFSNVWGVADEDLYNQVMKQADAAYAKKQPFMYEVMTTSNHRPYTFPDGIPGIKSKNGGREAGVKYADYAVGKFIAAAKAKPWFKDTVFVFVADHTAGAGGKIDLSQKRYHIPAIIYAPGLVKPQQFTATSSQIDLAPTLLGILNFSYYTKFYGRDLLHVKQDAQNARTFVSNYQKVAYLKHGQMTVLEPLGKIEYFTGEDPTPETQIDKSLLTDTIAYYQYASDWKRRMQRVPSVVKK